LIDNGLGFYYGFKEKYDFSITEMGLKDILKKCFENKDKDF
jgi:hypothetical protein